jgi:hypothetical protein
MWKVLIGVAFLAPPAFLMGVPFPWGLSALQKNAPAAVPLAWAVNGFTSVISASGAVLVAMTMGFRSLLILACLAYVMAGVVSLIPARTQERIKETLKIET